jgi:ABC-type lipoprotein release transport system permease subunit
MIILQGVIRMMASFNPGMNLTYIISFDKILFTLGLAMVSSFIGVLYPSIRALKTQPAEALKYSG